MLMNKYGKLVSDEDYDEAIPLRDIMKGCEE